MYAYYSILFKIVMKTAKSEFYGKDFAMPGKLLRNMHASANELSKMDMYAKLLASHASLSETDVTFPDYVIPTEKLRQLKHRLLTSTPH